MFQLKQTLNLNDENLVKMREKRLENLMIDAVAAAKARAEELGQG